MKNTTALLPTNSTPDVYDDERLFTIWLSCKIIGIILGLVDLYFFITHTIHCVSKYKGKNVVYNRQDRVKLLDVIIVPFILSQIIQLFADVEFILGLPSTDEICEAAGKQVVATNAIGIFCIYLFLWVRQRELYCKSTLANLNTRLTRFVSWVVFAAIFISIFMLFLLFFAFAEFEAKAYGCKFSEKSFLYNERFILLALACSVLQILLLALLLYSLVMFRRKNTLGPCSAELGSLIKRVFVIAVVCCATDLVSGVVAYVYQANYDIPNLFYNADLTINIACTILSFRDWKKRLFPWTQAETNVTNHPVSSESAS